MSVAWVGAGIAAAGVISQAESSRRAASVQGAAARDAAALQDAQYQQNRDDATPWREAGTVALGQLTAGTGAGGEFNRDFTLADFNRDPGYEFRRQQGAAGVENSAAARGALLSGASLKALDRYNQDYASSEFQNAYNRFNNNTTQRFNRLSSIAGIGQTATRDVAQMGSQNAQALGEIGMQGANARASGYVGQANAINSGIQTAGNWWMQNQAMNNGRAAQPGAQSSGVNWRYDDPYQNPNYFGGAEGE